MKEIFRITVITFILLSIILILSCTEDKLSLPEVSTSTVTAISSTTATSGGNVTNLGDAPFVARGVCWNTSTEPTISNNKTIESGEMGAYTSILTQLTPNTLYYVRAFATNGVGTSYGSTLPFTTSINEIIFNPNLMYETVIDINDNVYKTITIGTQTWMAENLKTTKYNDGTSIPNITNNAEWAGLSTPAYCWYNNDEATNKATYGALYNWYTVNTGKLCPSGWHVSTYDDWTMLIDYLGGGSVAGGKLKESGTTHWHSDYVWIPGTNESGFTALPGGYRWYDGTFNIMGYFSSWWSSKEYNIDNAYGLGMSCSHSKVETNTYSSHKPSGYYVRCVKD